MSFDVEELPEASDGPSLRERAKTPNGQLVIKVGVVVFVLTVVLLVFGIWWPLVSLSPSASDTQDEVRNTMLVFSIAAAPVMALVWGIAYYSLRHWRAGATEEPPEDGPSIRDNARLSLIWVVGSALLTAFLLVWGLSALTSTTTLGLFNVRCAELCGLNHAYMETTGTVLAPADFDAWVTSKGGTVGVNVPLDINKVEASSSNG